MERSSASPDGIPRGRLRMFATALVVVALDQILKRVVVATMRLGESRDVLGAFFRLTRTENTGAAFGFLRGRSTWFIVISLVASIAIVVFRREIAKMRRWEQFAFGLILGGAVGNLIDRIRFGAVVDFIDLGFAHTRWPSFNVADSAITIGVVLLAFNLIFLSRPTGEPLDAAGEREAS